MEDSEFVFKELDDTAEIMERGGLLPDGPNEEMELRDTLFQDGTCPKLRGLDIRVQEGLETTAEGIRHNVLVHSEELSDLCPEDKIRKEEEFETPPRGGNPRRWTSFQTDEPRDSMIDMGPVPDYVAAQRTVLANLNRPSNELSPVETLEGTVLEMRRDMENLQTENRFLRTRRIPGPVPLVRQVALTTTKVPGFNGSTSWEQYQQVFDAIALSNGWGDATAALQLLSHLQGDALSVALLLQMPRRSSRKELTHALSVGMALTSRSGTRLDQVGRVRVGQTRRPLVRRVGVTSADSTEANRGRSVVAEGTTVTDTLDNTVPARYNTPNDVSGDGDWHRVVPMDPRGGWLATVGSLIRRKEFRVRILRILEKHWKH